jgi:hypothetical protein
MGDGGDPSLGTRGLDRTADPEASSCPSTPPAVRLQSGGVCDGGLAAVSPFRPLGGLDGPLASPCSTN